MQATNSVWDTGRPNEPLYEKEIESTAWNVAGRGQFSEALVCVDQNTIFLYMSDVATLVAR